MRLRISLLLTVLDAACILAAPEVHIGKTLVTGSLSTLKDNVEVFKGLPYAEPPVGERRFQEPVLKTSLNASTFNATEFGFVCLQPAGSYTPDQMSEDCLSLNVYRPVGAKPQDGLPVLLGGPPGMTGSIFVSKGIARNTPIIVVTINYRSAKRRPRKNALNLGLKDQLMALRWVQENISNFGRNKRKVTLSGESAGAYSVDTHLHGSQLKSLARGAIVESSYGGPVFTPKDGNTWWADFVRAVPECAAVADSTDTFTCMKQVNSTSLLNAIFSGQRFLPVIDGPGGLIPDFPSRVPYKSAMPLLAGSNKDEGTLFVPAAEVNSSEQIREWTLDYFTPAGPRGEDALNSAVDHMFELYPNDPALGCPFGTGNETFGYPKEVKQYAAILGDNLFTSRMRALATEMSAVGQPTYHYHFIDRDFVIDYPSPDVLSGPALGTTHAVELVYIGLFAPVTWINITSPSAFALADQMQEYWVSFVASGSPNDGKGTARPNWPTYGSTHGDTGTLLQLDGQNLTTAPANYRKADIDFWNQDPILWRR
ncbi:extracellular triacylglycerol lipase precursor [Flagelloscypha sp. PMI_526]|nr:extracellular triacylglycerol lipase precursor [Flagelloscypha sp. PMI_526]